MKKLELANQRLQRLYEISKLLAVFKGAGRTVPTIFEAIRETLPLRTAILIVSLDPPILILSRGDGIPDEEVSDAMARARESCAYLADRSGEGLDEAAQTLPILDAKRKGRVITLPLVVSGRPTFGALQLEAARALDEEDLAFANTITNQLALAIDRERTAAARLASGVAPGPDLRDRYEALIDHLEKVFVWEAEPASGTRAGPDASLLRFPYVSARADKILGTGAATGEGRTWIDRVHGEDRDRVVHMLEAVARGERDQTCIHRCITATGEVRWFNTAAHLDSTTADARIQGVSVDVTELKQAEEMALRQLDFVQALTSSLGEGIVAVDLERRITFINPTAAALLACSKEPVLGKSIEEVLELVGHDDEPATGEHGDPLLRAVVTGVVCRADDSSMRRRDGTSFPVSYSAAPLARAGQVTGAVLVFHDIMDVKRAERHQRFLAEASALLAASPDYRETLAKVAEQAVPLLADLCMFDELGENGEVERLVVAGSDEERRRLAQATSLSVPRPGWKSPQALAMESGDPTFIGELPSSPDDDDHTSAVTLMRAVGLQSILVLPLLARGRTLGAMTLATVQADRKYSAADLLVAEDLARRAAIAIDNARLAKAAQRAIGLRQDVLAIVSHDLRGPLSVILLNLEALRKRSGLDAGVVKGVHAMTRAAKRMGTMLRDLLDTASIEAAHLSVVRSFVDPAALVAEAADALEQQAAGKVRIVREIAPGVPEVFADAARIQQVFANLGANALKFTAAGGTITFGAGVEGGAVRFSVSDTGSGIAEGDLGRLFDRFYQASQTARQGTGLGLFIVRGIIEAHGGHVWVESQIGAGSTFLFTVPTVDPASS